MELLNLAWDFFEQSGDIEGYMLYHELQQHTKDRSTDEKKAAVPPDKRSDQYGQH